MPSLYLVQPRSSGGGPASAADINQLVNTLTGNQNTPVNVRNTDPIAYTQQLQNTDAAGKAQLIYGPDGTTVLLRVQANGVVASPDGSAAAPIVTTTHTQTLTGKTLTSPTLTSPTLTTPTLTAPAMSNPVVSGTGGTPAGTLGFTGTRLLVGDGTVNESVNVGPWSVWTPTLNQGGAVAFAVNTAHYVQIGKTILVELQITVSAAGVGANDIIVGGFPVAPFAANADLVVGAFRFDGVTPRIGAVCMVTASTFKFQIDNQAGFLGTAPNVALANTNVLTFQASFEAL